LLNALQQLVATQELVKQSRIKASKQPKFKAGAPLKDAVNS